MSFSQYGSQPLMTLPSHMTNVEEEIRALALTYVQAQDLKGRTPEDALDMYNDALNRIHIHYNLRYKQM